ncbi:MAG: AAA family ATPase [Candidatus Omnitrophica bacterium]|nr:AAA family ATPase [Candidatus Omnitrophota bacterium]MBU1869236.1 AAA family ATPase [Candidatus Omnitrophota bacterium]
MYLDFYNLKKSPFNITSDHHSIFESSAYREALVNLLYGIQEKKGIILITGEVGTGKTTLCKSMLTRLSAEVKTSLILNPYFSEVQLLQAIIEDFGMSCERKNRLEIVKRLNNFLVECNGRGGNAVVIIDEAQNLSVRQLEQIRLLSNLETSDEKLLQIVLVGQPELYEKLSQPNLRQIRQRIVVKYHLCPLKEEEIREYIHFRLNLAGAVGLEFEPESYRLIYEFTKGIPRLINVLCDRALLLAFTKERKVFDNEVFHACIEEIR